MLQDLLTYLGLNSPEAPPVESVQGQPLPATYPTDRTLALARAAGEGYGSEGATLYNTGAGIKQVPATEKDIDYYLGGPENAYSKSKNNQVYADTMMKAYIAAKRNPLVALGWDPSKIGFSSKGSTYGDESLEGATSGEAPYRMWASTKQPSSIIHEATHRGILELMKDPEAMASFKESAGKAIPAEMWTSNTKLNEWLVRRAMDRNYGRIEELEDNKLYGKTTGQVSEGRSLQGQVDPLLDKLNELAAVAIAKKNRYSRVER